MFRSKLLKRTITVLAAVSVLLTTFVIPQTTAVAADYNYGEALQKSIMFYEFQRAGKMPENIRNNWRGDAAVNDGKDVGLDLSKGWFDAGDHVKFNLPMAYTVTMLGWSVVESRDAYKKSGQLPFILDNIKWATDYLINCHPSPNVFYYQVGDGGPDHNWWGPAEVMQMKRPAYKVDSSAPGSAVVGEAAAALAVSSIIFKETDPTYAALCLKHAKELYTFADTTRSDAGYVEAASFYKSWSGFYDELTWAALWLHLATNDSAYLAKAESFEPNWARENQSTTIKYRWGHCWDDKLMGSLLLLTKLTNKPLYKECIERHLDWWTIGVNGQKITYTPKGLAWLDQWGSLRYATTEAFLATVYADWTGADPAKAEAYNKFAKSQIDYALGSTGRSYVVGFGVNPPVHYHHRTAHGSWWDSMRVPDYHRHTLYGALVGGPSNSDGYTDEIDNYTNNEVACDYNAGFVGILAKMYGRYGGTPIANFNAIEKPIDDEFFVETSLNGSGPNYVEIRALMNNRSAWPARVVTQGLTFKYFVDISEAIKAGYKVTDLKVTNRMEGSVASQLKPWDPDKNIYYTELDFTGSMIYPGGQSAHRKEAQFRIAGPDGTSFMNKENDYSYNGMPVAGGTPVKNKYIPVYENGKKLFGEEPPIGNVTPTTPPPTATPTLGPTPTGSGPKPCRVDGMIRPDMTYTNSSAVLTGFKVEVAGTQKSTLSDAQGNFIIDQLPREGSPYTVKFTKTNYLARQVQYVAVPEGQTPPPAINMIEMWPGDIEVDGAINMSDVMQVAKYFNTVSTAAGYNADVDFDKDGAINMTDIMIIAKHFNATSASYPAGSKYAW